MAYDGCCATCVGTNSSGNIMLVGFSDDSLIMHDIRTSFKEKMRLEVGGHTKTVRVIKFSDTEDDHICFTASSDRKIKLWDLR